MMVHNSTYVRLAALVFIRACRTSRNAFTYTLQSLREVGIVMNLSPVTSPMHILAASNGILTLCRYLINSYTTQVTHCDKQDCYSRA